jgi:hypothetical protein
MLSLGEDGTKPCDLPDSGPDSPSPKYPASAASNGTKKGSAEMKCVGSWSVRIRGEAFAAWAMAILASTPGWAQQVIKVSGTPCAGCTIDRRLVLRVAGEDEPMIGPYMVLDRDSRGRWLMATMDRSPGVVAVYDAGGVLLQRFSRKGQGPGEHMGAHAIAVTRGDTVHLFDNSLRRHTVFSPSYQYVRSSPLDGQVFGALELSDGSLLINADLRRPNTVGFPLHILDAKGRTLQSYGVEVPTFRSDNLYSLTRAIAAAADGRVWIVPRLRYEPSLWTHSEKQVEIQRGANWFPPQLTLQSPGGARRPNPWVSGLWHDGGELLWVLVHVPDSRWSPPPQRGMPQGERGPPIVWDREYDTILEVINTRTGQLLATRRFDEMLRNILPGGYVAHYREDADVQPFLDVWQVTFSTIPGR